MGIIDTLKGLLPSKAPQTSGAAKAAAGKSDLTDIVSDLAEMRGDKISTGDAAGNAGVDKMNNIAKAGRDAGMFNMGDGTDVVGKSGGSYGSA